MKKDKVLSAVTSAVLMVGAFAAVTASAMGTHLHEPADDVSATGASSADVSSSDGNTKVTGTGAEDETETTSETTTEPTTEPTTLRMYTVTFLDFDGNVMDVLEVEEGDPINYSAIDTSVLSKHIDIYTEQAFSSWSIKPDFAFDDYVIQALYKTATISLDDHPAKRYYFSTKGNVSLAGLKVSIKLFVQTPEKDENGEYIIEESDVDISESCIASPASLAEAFADGDKARITVYPRGDSKELDSFDIICFRDLGDVNEDGAINTADAALVLDAYANMAASKDHKLTDKFKKLADVNMDGFVDTRDATYILKYYAAASASSEPIDWEYFFKFDDNGIVK